ncbi:unnamed protein product [Periconia digitata]|uniref:Uncharacterized protein n=1 Tax=Periconia digitata TaxID=1303443 RepID=A0A9W4XM41_9PLEO|nr:unnamed protein product [Periconia digitata]
MRSQRRRCASDAQPTCQSAACILPCPVPLLSHRIPFNEPTLDLSCLFSLGIGAGGREKHEDVVGLIGSFLRSAEETTAGSGA